MAGARERPERAGKEGAVAERARRARKPRPMAWIDVDGCTGCEWCVDFCPVDCIDKIDDPSYAGDGTHQVVVVDWDVCTGCTICAKECPWDTITMISGTEVEELLSAAVAADV